MTGTVFTPPPRAIKGPEDARRAFLALFDNPQKENPVSKTLEAAKTVHVAAIERHGEKLTIPSGMSLQDAAAFIRARMEYEDTEVRILESFDVLPFDGAHALNEVLRAKFGWAQGVPTDSFFGQIAPMLRSGEVAPGVIKQVPWGRLSLPTIKGHIETGATREDGRVRFAIMAMVLRRDEATVRSLFDEVREYLKTGSIYMGKAVRVRFRDDDGNNLDMPRVEFIDTSATDPDGLIYHPDLAAAIQTNLFTPITRAADCAANGIPLKRGILLGGTYGTGKTMAAAVAARLAVDAGITYVYVPHADELADAIEFARQYQSPACVVFCEDVDRVVAGERSVEMDDILNIIDGIDSKEANVITVLTTNDLHSINQAMLRPGRLDAIIDMIPPDAATAERLLRRYAGAAIAPDTDLTTAANTLAGHIPAVIAEVVRRAKLAQLRRQAPGEPVTRLSEEALVEAAKTMRAQVALLKDRTKIEPLTLDSMLVQTLALALEPQMQRIEERLRSIEKEVS